jgi:CRP-like cAMP-binding protein
MNLKNFKHGDIIFREGDPGECMYDIQSGKVGIYKYYGTANEKRIAELFPDQLFGEMGLLDSAPRSATAVALEDTTLDTISESEFYDFFREQPVKVLLLMQQMSSRLRRTTRDYVEACRTVYETAEAEKTGEEKSGKLMDRIERFCELAMSFEDIYMYY